jgi:hypothetical protein
MLKKLIVSLFFLYAMASIEFVNAENSPYFNPYEEGHIHNLSICATFNNEAYHLKEWIDHHQLLGVEHFYLYNLGSKDHFLFVLIPYINEGMVTLVNWPCPTGQNETNDAVWTLGTKIPAYENAVNFLAREETRWLVIVDIDEFLICPKGNLADLLLDYYEYPGISLSTEIYSDASQVQPVNFSAIYSKEGAADNEKYEEKVASKIIFKPEFCAGFIWPPYQCRLKYDLANIEADPTELKIRRLINRPKKGKPLIHKLQSHQDLKIAFFPMGLTADELQDNEQEKLPLYNCMPGFLKKIQKQYIENNSEPKKKLD